MIYRADTVCAVVERKKPNAILVGARAKEQRDGPQLHDYLSAEENTVKPNQKTDAEITVEDSGFKAAAAWRPFVFLSMMW